jgi:hypothetical protein
MENKQPVWKFPENLAVPENLGSPMSYRGDQVPEDREEFEDWKTKAQAIETLKPELDEIRKLLASFVEEDRDIEDVLERFDELFTNKSDN